MTIERSIRYFLSFIVCLLVFNFLSGCSTYSETKAPCNYEGTFCGTKMAIND